MTVILYKNLNVIGLLKFCNLLQYETALKYSLDGNNIKLQAP